MLERPTEDFVATITAVGMVTPVGHTARDACASLNAGLSRLAESSEFRVPDQKDHLVPAVCAAATGVTDGHRRFLRQYRMAVRAFREAVATANLTEQDVSESLICLCICESERIKIDSRIENQLMRRISNALDLPDLTPRTHVFPLGHAGVFHALQEAVGFLAQGRVRQVIVGAVDTYLDEATLDWLADINRLKTDRTVIGMIPGEGAAFLVVENLSAAVARGARPLARVEGVATAMEVNGIYSETPCRGDGLTQALQQTLAGQADQGHDTAVVICDLNGERYRALEWGLAMGRALGAVRRAPRVWHPATSIGDSGAAAGAINVAFGAVAIERGYVHPRRVLIWGSSDDGQRGSAYLRAAQT
jgi:3-oxoacyl-[acyl-carrier-protein] synthase-1